MIKRFESLYGSIFHYFVHLDKNKAFDFLHYYVFGYISIID